MIDSDQMRTMPQVGPHWRASPPPLPMASAAALGPGACRLSPGTGGWAHAAAAGAALIAAATNVLLAPSLPLPAVSWLVPGGNTAAGGVAWPPPLAPRVRGGGGGAVSSHDRVGRVHRRCVCGPPRGAARHGPLVVGRARAANVVLVDWSSTLPLTGVARAAAVAADAAAGAVGGGRRSRLRHPRRGGSRRRRRRGG